MEKFFFAPTFCKNPPEDALPQKDIPTLNAVPITNERDFFDTAPQSNGNEVNPISLSNEDAVNHPPLINEGNSRVSTPSAMLNILAQHEKSTLKITKNRNPPLSQK